MIIRLLPDDVSSSVLLRWKAKSKEKWRLFQWIVHSFFSALAFSTTTLGKLLKTFTFLCVLLETHCQNHSTLKDFLVQSSFKLTRPKVKMFSHDVHKRMFLWKLCHNICNRGNSKVSVTALPLRHHQIPVKGGMFSSPLPWLLFRDWILNRKKNIVTYLIKSSLDLEVFAINNYKNLGLNLHICSDLKTLSILRQGA